MMRMIMVILLTIITMVMITAFITTTTIMLRLWPQRFPSAFFALPLSNWPDWLLLSAPRSG